MPDGINVQLLCLLLLILIVSVSVISIDLTLKNKLKPAIILAIIVGLLSIVEMCIMLSNGLITFDNNVIPKN
jgi:hypothetical protein